MDAEDERDFWDDIPTYSSKRVHVGTRVHRGTSLPAHRRPLFAKAAPGERDLLRTRIGLLAGVALLLVPVAMTLRGGDDANVLRSASTGGAVALPAGPAPVVHTIVVTTVPPDTVPVPGAVHVAATATAEDSATTAPAAPRAAGPPVCGLPYKVVLGDYWIGIAQKTDVELASLLDINNATTATPLYPTRTICLPLDATLPSATTAAPATTAPKVVSAPATTAPKPSAPPTSVKPAATVTTTTLPLRIYSAAEVEAIIREVWPDELEDEALRIATRESNLKPAVRNSCCFGLFQLYFDVHKGWLGQIGVASASQLFDPRVNATAALTLYYRNGGWGPWQ